MLDKSSFPKPHTGSFNLSNCSLTLSCLLIIVLSASGQQTEIQYLSGTDKDNTVPWQFSVSSGRLAGIATNIPVPSCWQMQGFGTYSYTQNTGSGMTSSNSETGFYTDTFAVPSAWAGERIFLVFEGVMTDTTVRSTVSRLVPPTRALIMNLDTMSPLM